jgi:hypothetical protein
MLAAGDGGEKGEFVTVLQTMICRPVLTVDDPEESYRHGDLQKTYNIIDRRMVGQVEHLFIRAEGPQGCK